MRVLILNLLLAAAVPGLAVLAWAPAAAAAAPVRGAEITGVNRQILSSVEDVDNDSYYEDATDVAAEASSTPVEQIAAAGSCGRGYVAVGGLCGEQQDCQ
jgi:hypothetical protein